MRNKISTNLDLFNITELVYIFKAYHEKDILDNLFKETLEKKMVEFVRNHQNLLLEEICAVVDCLCVTKNLSRDFQKMLELVISQRMKDIKLNPKVLKFIYETYHSSGMCSVGLMELLYKHYC